MDPKSQSWTSENPYPKLGGPSPATTVVIDKDARAAFIRWRPNSNIEAQLKLLSIVHYLIAYRTSLDRQEMTTILDSVAHLTKKD